MARNFRLRFLHWPKGKVLKLAGIKTSSGNLCDPNAVQESLKACWAPVYAKHDIDSDAAHKLLRIYKLRNQNSFQFDGLARPDQEDFCNFICNSKESACGRNGITYSAYKARPEVRAMVFSNHVKNMTSCTPPLTSAISMCKKCGSLPREPKMKILVRFTGNPASFERFSGETRMRRLLRGGWGLRL